MGKKRIVIVDDRSSLSEENFNKHIACLVRLKETIKSLQNAGSLNAGVIVVQSEVVAKVMDIIERVEADVIIFISAEYPALTMANTLQKKYPKVLISIFVDGKPNELPYKIPNEPKAITSSLVMRLIG